MKHAVYALLVAFVPAVASAGSAEKRGFEIARDLDRANEGFHGEQWHLEMILVNAQGDKTTRELQGKVKETEGDGDKSIMTFASPADVRGTKLLTWTHKKGDDDQWLFMPSMRRTRRISAHNRSGSFMGSEFTYEDFNSQELEAYRYKFLRDTRVKGRPVWVLEQVPIKHKSGYSRMECWYDQEYMNPLQIKYYDRKGKLLKVALFKDYKRYRGSYWRSNRVIMTNKQTGKKTD